MKMIAAVGGVNMKGVFDEEKDDNEEVDITEQNRIELIVIG